MAQQSAFVVANTVEAFIKRRFEISDRDTYFNQEVNLWDGGYVDSLGMAELLTFLESTFNVAIPDNALLSPDFGTVSGIARLVMRIAAAPVGQIPTPAASHG